MSRLALPRPPRKSHPDEAQLDELLELAAAPEPDVAPAEPRRWMWLAALQVMVLSIVISTLFLINDLQPPYAMVVAVCLAGVLVRRAVAMTREPAHRRTSQVVRAPVARKEIGSAGWYEGGDGMLDAIRVWDRRMDWASGSPDRFASTVLNRLRDLTDERLRLRHSITRSSDPARARALLGEQLWQLLHDTPTRVPRPREIATAVDRLESL